MQVKEITSQSTKPAAKPRVEKDKPGIAKRLFVTDLVIALILAAGVIFIAVSGAANERLLQQQTTSSKIEDLVKEQRIAAFETHVAATALREDWTNAPRETRIALQTNLQQATTNFDAKAEKLVSDRKLNSLEEFESGGDALRQLSSLSKEILAFYAGPTNGVQRQNIGAELAGNYRFLFGILNEVEEITHGDVVQTQAQIAEQSRETTTIISIGVVLIILALALRLLLIMRWVVKPANRLAAVTTEFADGDITASIPKMHVRELQKIAKALSVFRNMTIEADELRKRSIIAQERARKADAALEQRVRDSEKLMAEERKKTVASLAGKFETSITSVVDAVCKAAQELSQTADQLASQANSAGDETGHIAEASTQAAKNVEFVAAAIKNLSASVANVRGGKEDMAADISKHTQSAIANSERVNGGIANLAVKAERAGALATDMGAAADKLDRQALELEHAAHQFAKLMRAA